MDHWDRDQDGLEESVYETGGSDSDRIVEVHGNGSSNEGESESGSDIDEENGTMKGVNGAIESENGDLSDLSETNEIRTPNHIAFDFFPFLSMVNSSHLAIQAC